jgi:hypothetical protein
VNQYKDFDPARAATLATPATFDGRANENKNMEEPTDLLLVATRCYSPEKSSNRVAASSNQDGDEHIQYLRGFDAKSSKSSNSSRGVAWDPDKAQVHDALQREADADTEAYHCLAETAIADLQEPVEIYSAVLQESFRLCPTQQQALPILAQGKAAYLPVEIRIFRMWKERWPERFPELLRRTHQAKKDLGLSMVNTPAASPAACMETWEWTC